MLKTTFSRLAALVASVALVACGGGGGGGGGDGGGNGGGNGSGGSLGGPSSSSSPCAPNLCVGFAYSAAIVGRLLTGSIKPDSTLALAGYSAHYSLADGALPQGMSLDGSTGAIHGTPTTNGLYSATVTLTVSGYSGSLSTHLTMQVLDPTLGFYHPATPIGPQDIALPASVPFFLVGNALTGAALSLRTPSIGGETLDSDASAASHVSFAVIGGQGLPPGLALDTATGIVSGTPTQTGVWLVQVQAIAAAAGGSTTFTGWAGFSVGPVIQESIGQPAAAPMQIPVHAAPGVQYTAEIVTGPGYGSTQFTYDRSTNVMTVTPAARAAGFPTGTEEGSLLFFISLPNGGSVTAGYVEAVR